MNETFASVWDALEDDPLLAEELKLRSEMIAILCSWVRVNKLTQVEAAALLKVTQPRISDLMRGKITVFGMDELTKMLLITGARLKVCTAPVKAFAN
ncbi:MAG: XRE family transcriptional regulator [Aeromicrobium sp.]|nr:XRE family transcriptional regulator [Burkholderiales bacterium]